MAGIAAAAFFLLRPRRPDPITSIAILPFDNLSSPTFDDAFTRPWTVSMTYRHVHHPIWSEFFADWKARAARGEFEVREFVRRPIPAFTPRHIAPQ